MVVPKHIFIDNVIDSVDDIEDINSLLKVPAARRSIMAAVDQAKSTLKSKIKEYFFNMSARLVPIPLPCSIEYTFELERIELGQGQVKWEVIPEESRKHYPPEQELPNSIIELMSNQPVDPETCQSIQNITRYGYLYSIFFIRALSDYFIGTIQRIPVVIDGCDPIYDATHYTELPADRKIETFQWYFSKYPDLREQIMLEFFLNILPSSGVLKRLI